MTSGMKLIERNMHTIVIVLINVWIVVVFTVWISKITVGPVGPKFEMTFRPWIEQTQYIYTITYYIDLMG